MGQRINYFDKDLEYSLEQRECEMLDTFYHRIFPDLTCIELVTSIVLQKRGMDKILHLSNGQSFTVDEKKRRIDYGDILLELWSVYEHRVRGWLLTTQCDYIVYVVMPMQKAYLLPTVLLRQAWRHNKITWHTKYQEIKASNPNYTTISIAIPPSVLLPAIQKEMEVVSHNRR